MLPKFFVIYMPKADVWDSSTERGVEAFLTQEGADSFVDVWANKGYICYIFRGEYLASSELGARELIKNRKVC